MASRVDEAGMFASSALGDMTLFHITTGKLPCGPRTFIYSLRYRRALLICFAARSAIRTLYEERKGIYHRAMST